jgi:hypothetical protein
MAPAAVPDPQPTPPWSQSGLWPHPCHPIADPTEAAAPVPRSRSSRAESCVLAAFTEGGLPRARHLSNSPRHGPSTRGGRSRGRPGDPQPRADPESTALPHVGTAGLGACRRGLVNRPAKRGLQSRTKQGPASRRRSSFHGRLDDDTSAPPLTGRSIALTKRTYGRPCPRLAPCRGRMVRPTVPSG